MRHGCGAITNVLAQRERSYPFDVSLESGQRGTSDVHGPPRERIQCASHRHGTWLSLRNASERTLTDHFLTLGGWATALAAAALLVIRSNGDGHGLLELLEGHRLQVDRATTLPTFEHRVEQTLAGAAACAKAIH